MPGERYTQKELIEMPREQFEEAAANDFRKPVLNPGFNPGPLDGIHEPSGADLTSVTPRTVTLGSAAPKAEPNPNAWRNRKQQDRDFTCPSGQTCRLRPLQPEQLLERGLLDQITRLEGLANELVEKAEGVPPSKSKMPSREDFKQLLEVLNLVLPLAVVEPVVLDMPAEGEQRNPDGIYPDDIDLEDRMAILEASLSGLRALDRFRHAG